MAVARKALRRLQPKEAPRAPQSKATLRFLTTPIPSSTPPACLAISRAGQRGRTPRKLSPTTLGPFPAPRAHQKALKQSHMSQAAGPSPHRQPPAHVSPLPLCARLHVCVSMASSKRVLHGYSKCSPGAVTLRWHISLQRHPATATTDAAMWSSCPLLHCCVAMSLPGCPRACLKPIWTRIWDTHSCACE